MRARAPGIRRALCCALLVGLLAGCGPTLPTSPAAQTGPSTRSTAGSTPSGPERAVATALAGLDRRAEVAQLFVAGVPLDDLGSGDALAAAGIGGLFLAGRSEAPATELAEVTGRWQAGAPGPDLWVAVDQEGGAVQTLRGPGFAPLPPALGQGMMPPDELATLADGMGAALGGAGLNLNLAPVADVVPAGTEPGNAPIGAFARQYGATAAEVVAAAGAVMEGLAAHDVAATLKHFPGLGRVRANTDTSAEVTDTVTAADDEQVRAFASLLDSPERPFVMMSSAVYTRIDPTDQAAFSPAVVTGLLRERLDFDGVVISDDLANAQAVRDVPPGERAVRFLAAGGTLVLTVDASIVPGMIDAVLERSSADPAFAAQVDDAVQTALLAKAHAGLLPG
jgi:beta-glucosidase-like glycosyl hydrolase